jgi:hypothetical protein
MKRIFELVLWVLILLVACSADSTPKSVADPALSVVGTVAKKEPELKPPKYFIDPNMYEDIRSRYYGRLYIPDLDIDVALYNSYEQYITDREDAANIFGDGETYYVIADHNNQEFSKLFGVTVGTKGYIKTKFGTCIGIECTSIFNGYNAGYVITDLAGNNVMGLDDYLMYTCNSYGGVFICLWTDFGR